MLGCVARTPLLALADRGVHLQVVRSAEPPVDGALRVDAGAVDFRVRGRGSDRSDNVHTEVAPGVRLQCELVQRVVAISAFVEDRAATGEVDATCLLGGVSVPVRVQVLPRRPTRR